MAYETDAQKTGQEYFNRIYSEFKSGGYQGSAQDFASQIESEYSQHKLTDPKFIRAALALKLAKGEGSSQTIMDLLSDPNNWLFDQRFMDTQEELAKTGGAEGQAQQESYDKWRAQVMQRLDSFSKEMNLPVDELLKRGDWGAQNAQATGLAQSQTAAYGAGVDGGGLSTMNTQRAVTDALGGYQMQRSQLGLQATGQLMGGLGQMSQDLESRRQYEQGINLQLQQARDASLQRRHAEQQAQGQMWGNIIGGTLGTIGGAFVGGAPGAMMGASLGSNIGGGIGGAAAGGYKPYNYTYPRGTSRPGSGGLGGYGNSQ